MLIKFSPQAPTVYEDAFFFLKYVYMFLWLNALYGIHGGITPHMWHMVVDVHALYPVLLMIKSVLIVWLCYCGVCITLLTENDANATV